MAAALHNRLFIPTLTEFFENLLELLNQSSSYVMSGDAAEFCSRRLEEYQRSLRVMLRRLEQYGRHTSEQLILDIAQLIDIIGRRIERLVTFYDGQTEKIENYPSEELLGEVRVGFVGRPQTQIAPEQIEILRNRLCFQWADIARMFGISSRTLVRRGQEYGMPTGREHNFSSLEDNKLDTIVREIMAITPQSGLGLIQGALRSRGLQIQRRRILASLRRLDPVMSALRQLRTIICQTYHVPGPNSLW